MSELEVLGDVKLCVDCEHHCKVCENSVTLMCPDCNKEMEKTLPPGVQPLSMIKAHLDMLTPAEVAELLRILIEIDGKREPDSDKVLYYRAKEPKELKPIKEGEHMCMRCYRHIDSCVCIEAHDSPEEPTSE